MLRNMPKTKANARLEKSYAEATAQPVDFQEIFNKAMVAVEYTIGDVARRIERNQRGRGGESDSLRAELETIGRIIAVLNDPRLDAFRKSDPDAGGREICRILALARKEHGDVRTHKATGEDFASKAPEVSGDKNRQNATPQDGADTKATGRRYSNRGVVVR